MAPAGTAPVVTAFLSHAAEDAAIAASIQSALSAEQVKVYAFETGLAHGHPIWDSVRRAITTSDYFFVLLSRSSLASEGVARELGLALQLEQTRATPVIIGITARDLPSMRIQPLDFENKSPFGPPLDFAILRNFSDWQNPAALRDFGRSLHPVTSFVTTADDPSDKELFQRSQKCILELFPELAANDYVTRIWGWLEECDVPESRWRDILAVLELNQTTIGFLYATIPKTGSFAFGNYFGVLKGSRHLDRARRLLGSSQPQITAINPDVRGFLFEVDVPDLSFLEEIAARPAGRRVPEPADRDRFMHALRALSRVAIYQRNGARTLTSPAGRPLPIPKPSQQETFLTDPVGHHLLMYYPWDSAGPRDPAVDPESLLRFLYDDLYGDAYSADTSEMGFEGYREYIAKLRADFADQIRGNAIVGSAKIPRGVTMLLREAEAQGDGIEL